MTATAIDFAFDIPVPPWLIIAILSIIVIVLGIVAVVIFRRK